MAKLRELLENGRSIHQLNYSVKISKLIRKVQRLPGLVNSKDLEIQTMPRLVGKAIRLRKRLFVLKKVRNRLKAENMVVVASEAEVSVLKSTTVPIVSSLQGVKARAVESKKGLKTVPKTITVSSSR